MKVRLPEILSKIVYALLALCFLFVLFAAFVGSSYEYKPLILLGLTLAALILMVEFRLTAGKREEFFKKHKRVITAVFLVFMGACQLGFSFPLKYEPLYDIGAIYNGAIEWVNTGTFASYYEYFGMFHNNYGGIMLFRIWFGIMKIFGVKDFFIPACILNSALSVAAIYLTGSAAEKLYGVRGRMTAYFMFLISLPFYFIAPAFYTDALTMVFPVLIFRLWLEARSRERFKEKAACCVLMGLAAGIGTGIKASILIMLIAVVIEGVLYTKPKEWLTLLAAGAAIVLASTFALGAIMTQHIGKEYSEEKKIPIVHWIMMGTHWPGGYDGADYEFTKSFTDPDERAAKVRERLINQLKATSAGDMLKLEKRKIDVVFCDGTYGLSDCVGCPHGEDNFLHGFLLNNGTKARNVYKHLTTGVLMALYALMIASCVFDVFGRTESVRNLAPRLAMLGLFIFFLFWESRWRYFSNFVPVIILAAAAGLENAAKSVETLTKKRRAK
ncbi:MAG: hypothetical protein K6F68_00830 [Clostridiales bacterium]|nr:hypothetical protein [Clostridiales bacterium]